ncbi:YigZ family protein [Paenisporosarcina sp. TG20]|uniref:YigZ family protein n=1 Tax=Paenisporosarcina sp. TG20 TaxID=1211706 RepID=UPI0002F611CB|nr:YigZ family protein [Paenisporosarcina sp. TG20]
MRKDYITVQGFGKSEINIQKSRFLTFVNRAESEQQAQAFIEDIKSQHKSANHNCSAYLIGEHDSIQKANDDGEPSGTAGVPILEVLKKQGLKDIVVVVTRYFGGIKLGSGGLIRAYGKSTSEGLRAAHLVERRLHYLMKVSVDYTWLGKVENEVRSNTNYPLHRIDYADAVEIFLYVPVFMEEYFIGWITELTNGKAEIHQQNQDFLEFNLQ